VTHFRFCPQCGHALVPNPVVAEAHRQDCPACGRAHFQNSRPTASALIVRDGRILLGRRAVDPFRGMWDVPGGFLSPLEHPEEGVVREIREETGLVVRPRELLGIFPDAYGESDEGVYTLNFYYLVDIVSGEPHPADDVADLRWFTPEALPDIAFSHQKQVLTRWREAMANERNVVQQP
jgi:8-oxo-dGTP diphosphatase